VVVAAVVVADNIATAMATAIRITGRETKF
jgi:hypothetical protein